MGYFMDWFWLALGLPDALPWKATRGEIPRWDTHIVILSVCIEHVNIYWWNLKYCGLFSMNLGTFYSSFSFKCQLIVYIVHDVWKGQRSKSNCVVRFLSVYDWAADSRCMLGCSRWFSRPCTAHWMSSCRCWIDFIMMHISFIQSWSDQY